MSIWQIVALIYGIITAVTFLSGVYAFFEEGLKEKNWTWGYLLIGLFFFPFFILYALFKLYEALKDAWKDGGLIRHYRKNRERKLGKKRKEEGYNRIRSAYERGELRRDELPRALDGIRHFEVRDNLFDGNDWRDLVYIENEYNTVLNDFFRRHPEIQFKHDIRVIYLPHCVQALAKEDVRMYWNPASKATRRRNIDIETSSLMDDLCYPEDAAKLSHGLISCYGWSSNHGAQYLHARYYPLAEGDDESVMQQIEEIAKELFYYHTTGFFSKVERPSKDDNSTDDFADEQFDWEIENMLDEIRERVTKLELRGISRKIMMKLFAEKQELSRLLITKDMRIVLPDYDNMEIKMEPLNKAVYILFLKHPEGIVFKHLPDYRKELADIYQAIKPQGLTEKAMQSIEEVTNPFSNSINEKCARIRGYFIAQFDEEIAKHYYIFGTRGKPKKIGLPRDLVDWE